MSAGSGPTRGGDPLGKLIVLQLPEGARRRNLFSRLLYGGEAAYDPLWRYVRKVAGSVHRGQGPEVRVEEYAIGLRSKGGVPARVDFARDIVYLGRKLTIPFSSLRGILIAQGLIAPGEPASYDLLLRVDGSETYLPFHRFLRAGEVTDLCEFLSKRMRVPLGVASRPLGFLIEPGSPKITHGQGMTLLHQLRAVVSIRRPDSVATVELLVGESRITLVSGPDPQGQIENWGILADELISIAARRFRPVFGA
jgi:hypothetical protein